ncbi:unnamed protein product, partial [Staurois parvus]
VSCDWSQLVTWYKAVVNSLVPCDLCDNSQISHIVSNDVRSDILLTTLHVITDWSISDHMIGSSHTTIGVPLCPEDRAGTGLRCCTLPGRSACRQGGRL